MPTVTTLHQVFALTAEGTPVSIEQVQRGKDCGCTCRACGTALIARQGDIRSWSFAHSALGDCGGAAESALHLAAKQILLTHNSLAVPAITLRRSVRLPDGCTGSATATRPAGVLQYHQAEDEKTCGAVRPDITLSTDFGDVFIEIVVTNGISREKHGKLLTIGVATLELTLRLPRTVASGTAWDTLRAAVLDSLDNKKWLIVLEKARLSDEATAAAMVAAEQSPAPPPQPVGRNSFSFGHTSLALRELPFGIVASVRSASLAVDPLVLHWLEKWGGQWSEKHRNWVFPVERGDRLREVLGVLEVRIGNETAYERHQRVLEEYNRQQDEG